MKKFKVTYTAEIPVEANANLFEVKQFAEIVEASSLGDATSKIRQSNPAARITTVEQQR